MSSDKILEQKAGRFLRLFQFVFKDDWSHSVENLKYWEDLAGDGTFLDAGLEDEGMNWSNRQVLLKACYDLADELNRRGVHLEPSRGDWDDE
jgi:hypothetical protein